MCCCGSCGCCAMPGTIENIQIRSPGQIAPTMWFVGFLELIVSIYFMNMSSVNIKSFVFVILQILIMVYLLSCVNSNSRESGISHSEFDEDWSIYVDSLELGPGDTLGIFEGILSPHEFWMTDYADDTLTIGFQGNLFGEDANMQMEYNGYVDSTMTVILNHPEPACIATSSDDGFCTICFMLSDSAGRLELEYTTEDTYTMPFE